MMAKSLPWMKFYPSDWRADPALRMVGLSARGLWMEMLCIMSEANPRGSLLINGKPVNSKQLASLVGSTQREVEASLRELEDVEVFSRDDDGTIYSRRMKRDDEKAARDKENGKGGGNPNLRRKGVNPQPNPPDKGGDKAQIPETRSQIPDNPKPLPAEPSTRPGDVLLDRLISACGGHVSRGSRIEFIGPIDALFSQGCDLERHILPTLARIVPKMTTPLNSWGAPFLTREILAARDKDRQANAVAPRPEDQPVTSWELPFRQWNAGRGHWPGGKYGPAPLDPVCKVPPDVLQAFSGEIDSAREFLAETAGPRARMREVA